MDADGTVVKNSGANLADRVDAGVYRISFDADITNCVYLATAGQDGGLLFEDYHLYTSRTGSHTVNVQIFDEKNNPFDRSFDLGGLLLIETRATLGTGGGPAKTGGLPRCERAVRRAAPSLRQPNPEPLAAHPRGDAYR